MQDLTYITKKLYSVIVIVLLFIVFYFINFQNIKVWNMFRLTTSDLSVFISNLQNSNPTQKSDFINMKYLLLWTNPENTPFTYFGEGQNVFVNKKCSHTNCYVTSDRYFLGDYTEFEAIVFNGPELNQIAFLNDLPKRRFHKQKYVFINIESAETYPVCTKKWNNYFNWTWTYKLDSSATWNYFIIRDSKNNIVGPKPLMHWINVNKMKPIDDKLKVSLSSKTKPAAWFVSNCNTASLREDFVRQVQEHLRDFNLKVDIYGDCGNLQCPKSLMNRCLNHLEKKYFFYFAFENSLSEDYVTEKLLYALNFNTVPVVFGGANYTRFMPNGIYLDARQLGPKRLAERMFEIMHNPSEYYKFFRWKKYYSYHFTYESSDIDVYCKFCEMLNDDQLMSAESVYKNFNTWWTPQTSC